uniref:Uncharacterized protein n=1 Tax=Physcomitrium patens TaxID=3218 RepID=A0A2K1L0M9_PHYPA|nr:hypothetical protein PHYPA_002366 [Physcomitrium patens]
MSCASRSEQSPLFTSCFAVAGSHVRLTGYHAMATREGVREAHQHRGLASSSDVASTVTEPLGQGYQDLVLLFCFIVSAPFVEAASSQHLLKSALFPLLSTRGMFPVLTSAPQHSVDDPTAMDESCVFNEG